MALCSGYLGSSRGYSGVAALKVWGLGQSLCEGGLWVFREGLAFQAVRHSIISGVRFEICGAQMINPKPYKC